MSTKKGQDITGCCYRVWLTSKRWASKKIKERDFDLTFEQIMILHILEIEEGLRISDIAEKSDRDRTTTSRMIGGLERRNLVVRVPDPQDERQKRVYLTRLAHDRLSELDELRDEFKNTVIGSISKADQELTMRVLNQLADRLEES